MDVRAASATLAKISTSTLAAIFSTRFNEKVGPTTDDVTIIESGLNDGDRVVTDGQYKLQQGATVAITAAAAQPGAAS